MAQSFGISSGSYSITNVMVTAMTMTWSPQGTPPEGEIDITV